VACTFTLQTTYCCTFLLVTRWAAKLNYGVEANQPTLEAIINIAFDQKLIPRRYSVEELFDQTTRSLA
jgi:hypothetical protein